MRHFARSDTPAPAYIIGLLALACLVGGCAQHAVPPRSYSISEFRLEWSSFNVGQVHHQEELTLSGTRSCSYYLSVGEGERSHDFELEQRDVEAILTLLVRERFFDLRGPYNGPPEIAIWSNGAVIQEEGFRYHYTHYTKVRVAVRIGEYAKVVEYTKSARPPQVLVKLEARLRRIIDEHTSHWRESDA